jgi:hypothetical protein
MSIPYNLPTSFINDTLVSDITVPITEILFDTVNFDTDVEDLSLSGSPRPDQLSYDLYGTTDHAWAILGINNVIDPYYDWIKDDEELHEYVLRKYSTSETDTLLYVSNLVNYYTAPNGLLIYPENLVSYTYIDVSNPSVSSSEVQFDYDITSASEVRFAITKAGTRVEYANVTDFHTDLVVEGFALTTNIEHEIELNERLRLINVISPSSVEDVMAKVKKRVNKITNE